MMLNLQTMLIAAAVAAAGGAYATHAYYSPRLELERVKVSGLADQVSHQNDALEDLADAGKKREEEAAKAVAAAQGEAAKLEKEAQALLRRMAPAGVSECKAVEDLLRETLGK